MSYLHGPTGAVGVHYGPVWLGGVNRDPNASNLNHFFLEGYDPWGNPEGVTAPARFGLGYRGELTIDGVVHLRNRDYHPGLHTFTGPDPLDGVAGTPTVSNRYHYANNDPCNLVDPLGLRADDGDSVWNPPAQISRAQELCGAGTTLREGAFTQGATPAENYDYFVNAVEALVAAGEPVHLRVRSGYDFLRGTWTFDDRCGDEFVAGRANRPEPLGPVPEAEDLPGYWQRAGNNFRDAGALDARQGLECARRSLGVCAGCRCGVFHGGALAAAANTARFVTHGRVAGGAFLCVSAAGTALYGGQDISP